MVSLVSGFQAIRKNRGDVLSPVEYRTIVELIRNIIKKYNFGNGNSDYLKFLDHISDFDNPHEDTIDDLVDVMIAKIYDIYINMVASPLSFVDFNTQIVPKISFLELLRRIIVNRYLYDKVKNVDGSVPSSKTVTLTTDWMGLCKDTQITLQFGPGITNERDFIRLGWNMNTTPYPVIANGYELNNDLTIQDLVFSTSSVCPYYNPADVDGIRNIPVNLMSNDLTLKLFIASAPTSLTTLFMMTNGVDSLKINMDSSKIITVLFNNSIVLSSTSPLPDGRVELIVTHEGVLVLQVTGQAITETYTNLITYADPGIFNRATLEIPYENLLIPSFGLQSLELYRGYVNLSSFSIQGFAILTDSDNVKLRDYDQALLIDTL